ncbi:hypothetical protein STEG23_015534, partial [Scotinomys teguina]
VLHRHCEIATAMDDDLSLGRAYQVMAKVLQSQGEMTEAIKYLEKVVKIARNNFQSLDVIRASTMLGDIYNEKGQYSKASEYFQQAFHTTVELMKMELMDEIKVHYGIARAHQMMLRMKSYIESADMDSLNCLLSWKESRTQIQYDPILDTAIETNAFLIQLNIGVSPGMQLQPFNANGVSYVIDENYIRNRISTHFLIEAKCKLYQRNKMKYHDFMTPVILFRKRHDFMTPVILFRKCHDFMTPVILFRKCHDLVSQLLILVVFLLHPEVGVGLPEDLLSLVPTLCHYASHPDLPKMIHFFYQFDLPDKLVKFLQSFRHGNGHLLRTYAHLRAYTLIIVTDSSFNVKSWEQQEVSSTLRIWVPEKTFPVMDQSNSILILEVIFLQRQRKSRRATEDDIYRYADNQEETKRSSDNQ